MKILCTEEQIENAKPSHKVPLECYFCGSIFLVQKKEVIREKKRNKNNLRFCSRECFANSSKRRVFVSCGLCGKEIEKREKELKKSKTGKIFCSCSCAATYNNTHKKSGTRRSKFEQWVESQILADFPQVTVLFNNKSAINSELDIYFPDLSFAIELNGIFHYEPIYGREKLASIKNNDQRKFQACLENEIELMIVDISHIKRFNVKDAKRYYQPIKSVIDRLVDT